jgi:hypothetical protein
MKHTSSQRGFIALMSTIVICAVLLTLMASTDVGSFYARADALGSENKDAAVALAESCINVALLALAASTDPVHYAPINQTVQVGIDRWGNSMTCVIKDAIHSGADVTIDAYASSGDSFGAISVTVSLPPNIQIISWKDMQ